MSFRLASFSFAPSIRYLESLFARCLYLSLCCDHRLHRSGTSRRVSRPTDNVIRIPRNTRYRIISRWFLNKSAYQVFLCFLYWRSFVRKIYFIYYRDNIVSPPLLEIDTIWYFRNGMGNPCSWNRSSFNFDPTRFCFPPRGIVLHEFVIELLERSCWVVIDLVLPAAKAKIDPRKMCNARLTRRRGYTNVFLRSKRITRGWRDGSESAVINVCGSGIGGYLRSSQWMVANFWK